MKFSAAMRTCEIIDCLSLHFIEMPVPPLVPAFIAAKPFFLLFGDLRNLTPAVFTEGYLTAENYRGFLRNIFFGIISAAE